MSTTYLNALNIKFLSPLNLWTNYGLFIESGVVQEWKSKNKQFSVNVLYNLRQLEMSVTVLCHGSQRSVRVATRVDDVGFEVMYKKSNKTYIHINTINSV